ncbi:acetyltransferase [Coccidioides immitis RS]|uniref:Acetyltransferase n=2 Tax=Coccidioides immitis TaxID=5501 RepID=J3K9P8_COCIM|nr:acetyltransferase [Coccidioides immitis RS]EAS31661.3 acetyltransferase [Coccidioides immitis RS]KMP04324.1 acetyltransferase [Coccidioides immitis RMSCC 2394]TPX24415.1 hypothetical protein DIZ76_013762 [Coccidioides immitis]
MTLSSQPVISDIHTLPQKSATAIIECITRLEKRTFPPSEAFEFTMDLWKKKPNTRVIYVKFTETASSVSSKTKLADKVTSNSATNVIGYAVYVRMKGTALLHKVCIAEPYRGQGVGRQLMAYIEQRLRREGCQAVQLWVDKDRAAARRLYARCGFEEQETVENYYGNGRTGIKMALELESR